MNKIDHYFWIVGIIVNIANGLFFRSRAAKYIVQNQELKPGYDQLLIRWFIFANIPFVIMGIGFMLGFTDSMIEYIEPQNPKNTFVLLFYLSILAMFLWFNVWIFFRDGAAFMAKHPGFISYSFFGSRKDLTSEIAIKIFTGLLLCGMIFSIVRMFL